MSAFLAFLAQFTIVFALVVVFTYVWARRRARREWHR